MKVNLVRRRVLAGKDKNKKRVYGHIRCSEKIGFDDLCKRISALSAATKGDVELVISGLLEVMTQHLSLGNIVQLADLGNFRLSAGSHGADTKEEFHVSMMKKPKVVFTPGKKIIGSMNHVRYEYLGVKVEIVDEDCPRPHE